MKNSILQNKWKEARSEWKKMRRDWKKEWNKLTHRDVRRIDSELDKIVGLFQERYGDSWEKSASLAERYFSTYRDRTQAAINARLHRKPRRRGWVWGAVVLVLFAVLPYVWRQFQGQVANQNSAQDHKSGERASAKPHERKPGATESKNSAGKTATGDWQATSGQTAPPS
jgi:uncharacterized protein YjbJ (UPF0337 family)